MRKGDDVHFVGYQDVPPHPSTVGVHLVAKVLRVDSSGGAEVGGEKHPPCTLIVWYEQPDQNPNPQGNQDQDAWKLAVPYDGGPSFAGRTYHLPADCQE